MSERVSRGDGSGLRDCLSQSQRHLICILLFSHFLHLLLHFHTSPRIIPPILYLSSTTLQVRYPPPSATCTCLTMADSATNLEEEAMVLEPSHELQTQSAEADIEQEPQVQELPNGFLNSDWTPLPTDYRLRRDPLAHNAGQPLDGPKLAHSDMDFAEITERFEDQMQSRLQGHAAQEPDPTRKYERESGVIVIDNDGQGYAAGMPHSLFM